MRTRKVQLGTVLLHDFFGEAIQKVGECLMKHSCLTLPILSMKSNIKQNEIKRSLCLLVEHGMVNFTTNDKNAVEYRIEINSVLRILRYPSYIMSIKELYGYIASNIIASFLSHGEMSMTFVLKTVITDLNRDSFKKTQPVEVLDAFKNLASDRFLQRCSKAINTEEQDFPTPIFEKVQDRDLYSVPFIEKSDLMKMIEENEKTDEFSDSNIYWRLNFERFDFHFRDMAICSAVLMNNDEIVTNIMRCFLYLNMNKGPIFWQHISEPYSRLDLEGVVKEYDIKPHYIDDSLKILTNGFNGFLTKTSEGQGGMYAINFKNIIDEMALSSIDSIVRERFGEKCHRIFRIVRLNGRLEQKQIEEKAMYAPRDTKEYMYKLLSENFFQVQELSQAADHAPSRTVYLFYVDIGQVASMLLEWSYVTTLNLHLRQKHEENENRRLLDKENKVLSLVKNLQTQGVEMQEIEEVENTISPPEKTLLARLKNVCSKLELSTIQLDELIFLLEIFLSHQTESKVL